MGPPVTREGARECSNAHRCGLWNGSGGLCAMADYVRLDVTRLRDAAGRLGTAAAAISDVSPLGSDVTSAADGELTRALADFTNAWQLNQQRLIESVSAARTLVETAADAYERLDQSLARLADTAARGTTRRERQARSSMSGTEVQEQACCVLIRRCAAVIWSLSRGRLGQAP
jgi:hypothetical protein